MLAQALGLQHQVLAVWVALSATELRVRPERLFRILEALVALREPTDLPGALDVMRRSLDIDVATRGGKEPS